MLLISLPILSIVILSVSISIMFCHLKKQNNILYIIFLAINGLCLVVVVFIITSFIFTGNITFVPAWIYWLLIIVAIFTGIVATAIKFVAGQFMSAGLLLFTGFVSLFSIGTILLILCTVEFIWAVIYLAQNGRKVNS